MTNPHKGEIEFKVGDKSLTLSLSFNAFVELEQLTGLNPVQVGEAMQPDRFKVSTMKSVFWAALRDKQQTITMEEVTDILRGMTLTETSDLLGRLFNVTFDSDKAVRPTQEPVPAVGAGNGSLRPGSQ